ncbi:MAG: acetate--CoA ligase family protein [Proteobacteria bacterium]|nr:acetate--CoA ligase family protein [Pseudomonadota bacterium]
MRDLQPLVRPNSVAVIGASPDTSIIRGRLFEFLRLHAFAGPVYPVSRSHAVVQGLKAYPSVADLPEAPDLAIIVVPAEVVPETLEQCGARGIKAALIISSGFGEATDVDAAARDHALRAIARRYGMALGGPNSEGLMIAERRLAASFSPVVGPEGGPLAPETARGRPIAVVGQSGAMTFAFVSRGRPRQLRFEAVISSGNQVDLEAHDYVDYWLETGGPEIFILYIEQIVDGRRFRAVAERALALGRPLIVARIGRSDAGRRAAASHTGALAAADRLDEAVFRHYGVIQGDDLDHITDIAAAFACCAPPRGNRVAIITGSGGGAAWMADLLSAQGLEVPVLEDAIQAEIAPLLPSYASAKNPIDATAQAIRQVGYATLVEIVQRSRRIDVIVLIGSLAEEHRAAHHATVLAPLVGGGMPIVFCSYTVASPQSIAHFAAAGIPCFTAMQNCARAIRAMVDHAAARRRHAARAAPATVDPALRQAVDAALRAAGATMTEWDAKAILARYGVPRPAEHLAISADDAVAAAARIGGAVALKLQSQDLPHKTEAGAVMLGVTGDTAVRAAYETVMRNGRAAAPRATIQGVLVQAMASPGREIILGVTRHDGFGPMLMVGLGGIHVEALKDVAFAPVPLDETDALALIDRLNAAALLGPVRGQPAADRVALARLMALLSRFAADHADAIAEIDLNPVIVHPEGQGLTIVDALIVRRSIDADGTT